MTPPILTRAEAAADARSREFPRGVSAEERLMALADAGRRARAAWSAAHGAIRPDARPEALPDGRVVVDEAVWNAMATCQESVGALIALAVSGDVEGRY